MRRPTFESDVVMNAGQILALAALLVASNLSAAIAQETRAEVQRQQREEKQRAAKPYKPSALERGLKAVERGGVPFITRDGLYAKLGSITTGSGFAYGAGTGRGDSSPTTAGLTHGAGRL